MKASLIPGMALCLLMGLIQSGPLQAQFFKDILNTVKQTAQNRANSKASQTTNKVLDKVDSSTSGTGNGSKRVSGTNSSSGQQPQDSAATHSVLGAFAKAAAQNPNDTSSADLTMKALGLLAGGGGVSAQDSVAAINSFKNAEGGGGVHYAYRINISSNSGKKKYSSTDTTNMYFTNNGEGRIEMRIPMPGVQTNRMISIGRIREPQYTILLYPGSKTYLLNIIDTNLLKGRDTYQITKIGSENADGYSCTHSRLVTTTGSGMFASSSTMDIWTSNAVPGASLFKSLLSLNPSQAGVFTALENAGCGGTLVKISISGKDYTLEEDLIRAEKKNYPADLFKIPGGYSESTSNMFSHMVQPANE
jgi:hypothetical protein